MVILNELWIISHYGLSVYHQALTDKISDNLFAGFISAIINFAQELGEDEIKKLEMAGTNLVVISSADKKWFFIGRAGKKVKEKKIFNYLDDVRHIFFEQFGTILEKYSDDLNVIIKKFRELDKSIDLNNPESPRSQEYIEKQKSRGAFL